ncbi:MAG: FHA domain-containing protein [Planctomycetota bacterium]
MQVKLKVLSGSHEGKEIPVSKEKFLIGRSDSCHLRPKSESISRKHAILVIRDGKVLAQDLKSRNGTFVNDKRLPSDRAKVLQPGDVLKFGKLMFELVIEHGLSGAKRPVVSGVEDAAARTVAAGSEESRFEELNVNDWLEEADQIDRVRKMSDSNTRQFRLDGGVATDDAAGTGAEESSGGSTDLSMDDSSLQKSKRPEKQKPGKLPEGMKKPRKDNSRDAADDALKRFFTR